MSVIKGLKADKGDLDLFSGAEISVFLDELDDKIQVLNDGFLALERDGEVPGIIQEIFRAAHTIKGSSAIMGYDGMTALTHEMENLFDCFREGTAAITPETIDLLFEALDTLKLLRDQAAGRRAIVDAGLLNRLKGELNRTATGGLPPAGSVTPEPVRSPAGADDEEAVAPSPGVAVDRSVTGDESPPQVELGAAEWDVVRGAAAMGRNIFRIGVGVDRNCQMKSVRAFLVFERLGELGEIIQSAPGVELIEDGRFGRGFGLLFVTSEDRDYLQSMLMTIAEVDTVSVEPVPVPDLTEGGGGEPQTPPAAEGAEERAPTTADLDKLEAGAQQAPTPAGEYKAVKTVRIDVLKLDSLMNLVGELVIERTRLDQFAGTAEERLGSDEMADTLNEISNHLGHVTGDLQEQIMKARMLPIGQVFNRFPRMVRDLAHKMDKKIELVIEGRDTELDRNVIEVISDPLIHLIRNAVDHGIEPTPERRQAGKPAQGTLLLRAHHHENHIVIVVEDDGRGLDPMKIKAKALEKNLIAAETADRMSDQELLNLVFRPGFSTAASVSDLSGRGVGMDVVRSQIEQVNGSVEISGAPGKGTSCVLKLPLTLVIIRALLVRLGDQVYALPLSNVLETVRISRREVRLVKRSEVVVVRGAVLPLIRLCRVFGQPERDEERLYVVIVGAGDRRVGVVVDKLIGEQEIVIKSLGRYLGRVADFAGATILGDGRVALIIDVRTLISGAVGSGPGAVYD